jgi:hypothetical protein
VLDESLKNVEKEKLMDPGPIQVLNLVCVDAAVLPAM